MRMADEKEKLAARAALAGDKLPMYFAALEKIMVANGNDNNFQFHEENFKTNYFYEFLYVLTYIRNFFLSNHNIHKSFCGL